MKGSTPPPGGPVVGAKPAEAPVLGFFNAGMVIAEGCEI
jgi:hypothetical protein